MNPQNSIKNKLLTKKILIQTYFIIFIFLNLIDFLNIIGGDLDLFKKLLSWTIIGYIFYKVSFTKIFIGIRLKTYDLLLILAFSLMSIVKSIILYTQTNIINLQTYPLSHSLLKLIANANPQTTIQTTFLIGLILTIIISITILTQNKPQKKSLIGSLSLKDNYFANIAKYLALTIISLFFGIVIFNFFMEWFALAIDSVILVIGLIYYLFIYLHSHTKTKVGQYLQDISNTGNDFYKKLISLFSDKKTLFIAISFLLTIHTLVDFGVYMVPYTIGTQNTLYFSSLSYDAQGTLTREHTPLFNLFNHDTSRLKTDITNTGKNILSTIGIIILYLSSLITISLLLIMPFYIFYKNITHETFKLPKIIPILILSGIVSMIALLALPNLTSPLKITTPIKDSPVKGIDIYTTPITTSPSLPAKQQNQISIALILYLSTLSILILRYNKHKTLIEKTTLTIILIFFIIYILTFFINSTEKTNETPNQIQKEQINFTYANSIYQNPNTYKIKRPLILTIDKNQTLTIKITPFSNITTQNQLTTLPLYHLDFLHIEITNPQEKEITIETKNPQNLLSENKIQTTISKPETTLICLLGTNKLTFKKKENIYELNTTTLTQTITENLQFKTAQNHSSKQTLITLQNIFSKIRTIFMSIFYIFGTLFFAIFYIKKNILKRQE